MNWGFWGKGLGLGLTGVLLLAALANVNGLVQERQMRQHQAQQEVAESTAGSQVLSGPLLRRVCTEEWTVVEHSEDAKGQRKETRRRETQQHELTSTPESLMFDGGLEPKSLERGLFKINTYQARLQLRAQWRDLADLRIESRKLEGTMRCAPIEAHWRVSDARGVRQVEVRVGAEKAKVMPGSTAKRPGFHTLLADRWLTSNESLSLQLELELLGTESLYLVPGAAQVQAKLHSSWPHPSFQGRFLPNDRQVKPEGFRADWRITELASNAAAAMRAGEDSKDLLGVELIDPVNPYSLSDRALKYAFLFVGLSLGAVALAELIGRRRLHPVQYGFVGLALVLFFLLLLALSEHLSFGLSYGLAASASTLLLGAYASNLFGSRRGGLAFGAALGAIYGALYTVLNLEKAALLFGAVLLFTLLALAMGLTRKVNWYRLGAQAE